MLYERSSEAAFAGGSLSMKASASKKKSVLPSEQIGAIWPETRNWN